MSLHRDLPLPTVALAVLLVGPAFAGCLSPDDGGVDGGNPALALDAFTSSRTTAPSGTVAFPLAVGPNATNASDGNFTVEVVDAAGLNASSPPAVSFGENGTGVFLEVDVPEDAEAGNRTITVRGTAGDVVGPTRDLHVNVSEPDEVVEPGDKVQTQYIGRFPNGSVFATSLERIDRSPHPKAGMFRGGGPYQPLNVTVGPNARFIEGFNDGVIGTGVGHDTTFTVPPGQGYGNATVEGTTPRTETLNRTITQERQTPLLDRSRLEKRGLINESSEEGDNVTVGSGDNTRTYNITFLNETKIQLTLIVEEGDVTTHYQQWPNSSEAVHVNETHVEYYVTPTTDVNETFTYHDYWPDASKIVELTNETIVVQHTPEVGTTYTPSTGFGGGSERTVTEVKEDTIVYEEENTHPLAGETLVFDVRVLDVLSEG